MWNEALKPKYFIARQRLSINIPVETNARNNRRGMFSVGAAPKIYNEDMRQLELDLVEFRSWQLQQGIDRVSRVGSRQNDWEETARKELGCAAVTGRLL
jgi:hypothetical protein